MNDTATLNLIEQRRHRALNRIQTLLLLAGSLGLLAVTAFVFAGLPGVLFALVFGAIAMAGLQRVSPRLVLAMYKARPAGPTVFPSGNRIIAELARRAGLEAPPLLYIVPSQMMNAFAVGRREESAIAITDALARNMTTRELAGVLAHEMSHIANEDLKVMALADIVTRYTAIMSLTGFFSLFVNIAGIAGGYGPGIPWFAVLLLMAAPTIGSLLQLALSRTREFDADLNAAMLTGDPDGLALALAKLERVQGRLWESMMLPGARVPDPSVLRSHPSTAERIGRLMALKGGSGPASPAHRSRGAVPSVAIRAGLASGEPLPPLVEEESGYDFDETQGRPRIRIRRGGVWW
ncbi:MAG: M48 family metalloprotease [Notoacmeibacter sp.]|nr:M48 family metalloprotease [Notoacmeibacter sp.]